MLKLFKVLSFLLLPFLLFACGSSSIVSSYAPPKQSVQFERDFSPRLDYNVEKEVVRVQPSETASIKGSYKNRVPTNGFLKAKRSKKSYAMQRGFKKKAKTSKRYALKRKAKSSKRYAKKSKRYAKKAKASKKRVARKKTKSRKRVARRGSKSLRSTATRLARQYGVPVKLAHAVITVESSWRPSARGAAGEVGLMQIKPATARGMGYRGSRKALYNPSTNMKWGMKYLAGAYKRSGGTTCGTILRYNAGHYAKRMNPISARYCQKVKRILRRGA